MAYTTGRCTNDLYCSAASGRQFLRVPIGSQFVCPQCGKPLSEPVTEKKEIASHTVLACCALVAAGGALFAIGAMMGDRPAAHAEPVQTSVASAAEPADTARSNPAEAAVDPPRDPAAGPPDKEAALPHNQGAATEMPAETPSKPTHALVSLAMLQTPARYQSPLPKPPISALPPPPLVAQQPSPGPAQPLVPAPSQSAPPLQSQDMAQAQARANLVKQARAAELAKRAKAAEQQKLLAQQAEDQRRKAEALQAEAVAEQAAKQRQEAAQAAALALQARQHLAAEAQKTAAAAALPKGPSRAFSPKAVAGGAPGYPTDAESEGRIGHVTVSCLITQTGTPRGCHVLASQGGAAFNRSVLGWLGSGQVRFAPILHDGAPQAEEHSWSMDFEP